MAKLKNLRIEIQRKNDLNVDDVAKEATISVKTLYRMENVDNIKGSSVIKYLEFLRKNKVDINKVLKEIFEEK